MPRPTDQERALAAVRKASQRADAATEKARKAVAERDAAVYDAKHAAGCTYADLAVAMGLSRDRVSQVLVAQRRQRENA